MHLPPLLGFANYRPLRPIIGIIRPPPSSVRCSAVARPSMGFTCPSDAGGRPESEDCLTFSISAIRAINSRLKIQGHPAPPVSESADRAGWPATEGAKLRREAPLQRFTPSAGHFQAEFAHGRRFADLGSRLPRPSIDCVGRWEREFGERAW